jgi:signal transduction histidine kinase
MRDIALHVLDVAENAIRAGAVRIEIRIHEDADRGVLRLEIIDDGRGMDGEEVRRAMDPFYTTKPGKKVGLGLPLLAQAARESGGTFDIDSEPEKGTRVHAVFGLDHPDRKPLGDIAGTLELMQLSHPEVEFVLTLD